MAKYAVYKGAEWVANVHADNEAEAREKAEAQYPGFDSLELVSDQDSTR